MGIQRAVEGCQKGTNLNQDRTSRQYIDFITILSVLNSKTRVKMPVSSDPWWFYVGSDSQTGFVWKLASDCQVAALRVGSRYPGRANAQPLAIASFLAAQSLVLRGSLILGVAGVGGRQPETPGLHASFGVR